MRHLILSLALLFGVQAHAVEKTMNTSLKVNTSLTLLDPTNTLANGFLVNISTLGLAIGYTLNDKIYLNTVTRDGGFKFQNTAQDDGFFETFNTDNLTYEMGFQSVGAPFIVYDAINGVATFSGTAGTPVVDLEALNLSDGTGERLNWSSGYVTAADATTKLIDWSDTDNLIFGGPTDTDGRIKIDQTAQSVTLTGAGGVILTSNGGITLNTNAGANGVRLTNYTLMDSFGSQIQTESSNVSPNFSHQAILINAAGGNITATLPACDATYNGKLFEFKRIDSSGNTVTIDGDGQNIDGAGTFPMTTQYQFVRIQCNATQWWIMNN